MNQPKVMTITFVSGSNRWESGEVVSLEDIAQYIESGARLPGMWATVPGESRNDYAIRLLKALAAEVRAFKR